MESSIFRRLRLATFAFLALVVLALVVSAGLTMLEARRLRDAHAELERLGEFERVHLVVTRRISMLAEGAPGGPRGRPLVFGAIDRMIELSSHPETPARLRALRARLEEGHPDEAELAESLTLISQVYTSEQAREAALLARLERENEVQLRLEMAAPLALLALGVVLFPVARRRLIAPLDAFGRQLARLADGEFTPAPVDERVDPFLLPLHRQFNYVAHRLQELEAAHREREATLEDAVRTAIQRLLDQHRSLARAERLAATGELAASVAHELRNPLAGIQMTLSNLRHELTDPELIERVDLSIEEVARLSRLLAELLDAGRHAPEAARPVRLAELVDEMVALSRFQLPPDTRLESRIDPALTWHLPQDRLRQALLNLALNAVAALAGRPGTIVIDAAVEGGALRLSVSDDGPGFPPELLEGGIRPFFSTRERGTGLGLAMVRRFARDAGGSVELANCAPHGARVTLVLPADGAPA